MTASALIVDGDPDGRHKPVALLQGQGDLRRCGTQGEAAIPPPIGLRAAPAVPVDILTTGNRLPPVPCPLGIRDPGICTKSIRWSAEAVRGLMRQTGGAQNAC